MTEEISDEQAQELMDVKKMELEPKQILDGIARTLLSATIAFETKSLTVNIDNVGSVEVSTVLRVSPN